MTDKPDRPSAPDDGRRFVLGMGCEGGAPFEHVLALAERALSEAGIEASQLLSLASIEMKRDEPAILATAAYYETPAKFFDAATLERETPRLKNPSDLVFAHIGCHGVAEAAALAAAGPFSELVVAKVKSAFATAAVAEIMPDAERDGTVP